MSFASRLLKFRPMAIAAAAPTKSIGLQLCLPRLLVVDNNAVGLANLEVATLLVAGVASTRLLCALAQLLHEPSPSPAELVEAAALIQQHLTSLGAASDQAHAEHEAAHQHKGEGLN